MNRFLALFILAFASLQLVHAETVPGTMLAVDTAYQASALLEPWITKAKRIRSTAIPLQTKYAIAFLPDGDGRGATLQSARSLDRIPANLVRLDSELKIALYQITPVADKLQNPANPVVNDVVAAKGNPDFQLDPGQIPLKTALRASGFGQTSVNGHTVFYEGMGSAESPAGNALIPVIKFSGFQKDIAPGHILTNNEKILGIIVRFDVEKNQGHAIPAALLGQFLELAFADIQRSRLNLQGELDKPDIYSPDREFTITRTTGIRGTLMKEGEYLNYAGLVSRTPAFQVTGRVLDRNDVRDVLPGDLLLGAENASMNVHGLVTDSYYGDLPLPLAVCLTNGRFRSDDSVTLSVMRDRVRRLVRVPLFSPSRNDQVVPSNFRRPGYLISGGIVFLELSRAALASLSPAPSSLEMIGFSYSHGDNYRFERVVYVQSVLPLKENEGYSVKGKVLVSVNGISIRNLKHLSAIIRDSRRKNEDIVLSFSGGEIAVFAASTLASTDEQVRKRYGIPFLSAETGE